MANNSWINDPNWHIRTMARFRTLSNEQLEYIRNDAYEAAKIAENGLNNAKAGQYWDEVHYANMELRARQN